MSVRPELTEILVCPKCKGKLVSEKEPEGFGCVSCGLLYKIEDGIPNFLIDEALSREPSGGSPASK